MTYKIYIQRAPTGTCITKMVLVGYIDRKADQTPCRINWAATRDSLVTLNPIFNRRNVDRIPRWSFACLVTFVFTLPLNSNHCMKDLRECPAFPKKTDPVKAFPKFLGLLLGLDNSESTACARITCESVRDNPRWITRWISIFCLRILVKQLNTRNLKVSWDTEHSIPCRRKNPDSDQL